MRLCNGEIGALIVVAGGAHLSTETVSKIIKKRPTASLQ
jgi:hypothetical protein